MRVASLALVGPLALWLAGAASAQVLRDPPKVELSQIGEHMEVVGADGLHVGTVDKVEGGRILLTKGDAAARGTHHTIPYDWVDTISEGRLRLKRSASEAMAAWDRSGRPGDDPKR